MQARCEQTGGVADAEEHSCGCDTSSSKDTAASSGRELGCTASVFPVFPLM